MAYTKEKERAQQMRKLGLSLTEIVAKLKMNKSTVSNWCKDIPLANAQIDRLRNKSYTEGVKALLRNSEEKRRKRIAVTKNWNDRGRKDVGNITSRDMFFVGLGLYWGEGYKKGSEELGFTNSVKILLGGMLSGYMMRMV